MQRAAGAREILWVVLAACLSGASPAARATSLSLRPDPVIIDLMSVTGEFLSVSLESASVSASTVLALHADWTGAGSIFFQFVLPDGLSAEVSAADLSSGSSDESGFALEIMGFGQVVVSRLAEPLSGSFDLLVTLHQAPGFMLTDLGCGDLPCAALSRFEVPAPRAVALLPLVVGLVGVVRGGSRRYRAQPGVS